MSDQPRRVGIFAARLASEVVLIPGAANSIELFDPHGAITRGVHHQPKAALRLARRHGSYGHHRFGVPDGS